MCQISRKGKSGLLMAGLLIVAMVFIYLEQAKVPATTEVQYTLNIALYPYVPRLDQFEETISDSWKQKHPDIALNFVEWDCYSEDPPEDLDVFVFDAIFFQYFVSKGYLKPMDLDEIDDWTDILEYALEGSQISGTYYGIPQFGCTNLLYYREDDEELKKANTLSEVYGVIGNCSYTGVWPPPGEGLMVDLSGGTTDSCLYLATVELLNCQYTLNPTLPDADHLNRDAVANLQTLVKMAGRDQAAYSEKQPYERALRFGEGSGRATVGFTESMSVVGEECLERIEFKLMPFTDSQCDFSFFYIDIISINSKISDPKREDFALELANLVGSSGVMTDSLKAWKGHDSPQYLLPVRKSVFVNLQNEYPLYGRIYGLVQQSNPKTFQIGPTSKEWLKQNKDGIKEQILGESSHSGFMVLPFHYLCKLSSLQYSNLFPFPSFVFFFFRLLLSLR